jgi:hypothetical protein
VDDEGFRSGLPENADSSQWRNREGPVGITTTIIMHHAIVAFIGPIRRVSRTFEPN